MTGIWLHKDKKRLYKQRNFAASSETEDGIPLLCVERIDGTYFWHPRSEFQEVTYEDVERAFIKLGWSF